MSNMKAKKPIKTIPTGDVSIEEARAEMVRAEMEHRLEQMHTESTPYGVIRYALYPVNDVVFKMREITVHQQEQITGLLAQSGMPVANFNDLMAKGQDAFLQGILVGLASARFLEIVLTANGEPLAEGYFDAMPAAAFNRLLQEVLADFFYLNTTLLERFMLYAGTAVAEEAGMIGSSPSSSQEGT